MLTHSEQCIGPRAVEHSWQGMIRACCCCWRTGGLWPARRVAAFIPRWHSLNAVLGSSDVAGRARWLRLHCNYGSIREGGGRGGDNERKGGWSATFDVQIILLSRPVWTNATGVLYRQHPSATVFNRFLCGHKYLCSSNYVALYLAMDVCMGDHLRRAICDYLFKGNNAFLDDSKCSFYIR